MQVYCKKCRWSYDLPGATAPGSKLRDTPCTHCKQTGVLTRYKKALRDGTLSPAALRSSVKRMVTKAARTGKLPNGEPLAPHTLLEQMAGLEPEPGPAGGFYARHVKKSRVSPAAVAEVDAICGLTPRERGIAQFMLQKQRTRAAVVQAKATKRELRRIASSLAALAEVVRVGVDLLGEVKGTLSQVYAGFDCCVRLLVDLRDGKAAKGPKALRDFLDPEPDLSPDLSALLGTVRENPEPGDVLTFDSGTTWTVNGTASGVVLVAHCVCDGSATHEKAVTREEWRNAVDSAHQIARPGILAFDRSAPRTLQQANDELTRDALEAMRRGEAERLTTRERVAINPRRGDVLTLASGLKIEVRNPDVGGEIICKYSDRLGTTSIRRDHWESVARNAHTEVTPSPLAGDETEAEADAILAQKPENAEGVKP